MTRYRNKNPANDGSAKSQIQEKANVAPGFEEYKYKKEPGLEHANLKPMPSGIGTSGYVRKHSR